MLSLSAFLHAAPGPRSRVRSPSTAIILSPISLVTLAPCARALSYLTTLASSAFEVRISATSALSRTLLCPHSRVRSHFDSFCSLRILAYHARTPFSHAKGAPLLMCDAILAAFLARRSTVVFWQLLLCLGIALQFNATTTIRFEIVLRLTGKRPRLIEHQ